MQKINNISKRAVFQLTTISHSGLNNCLNKRFPNYRVRVPTGVRAAVSEGQQ